MTIRTILAGSSGSLAGDGAVEIGCRLARRFGAHLETYHARVDVEQVLLAMNGYAGVRPIDAGWLGELEGDAIARSARARKSFTAKIARWGVAEGDAVASPGASAAWREETGDGPLLLARRARFFDLIVLGCSGCVSNTLRTDAVEEVLLQSGRPVLLAPANPRATLGDRVMLGWDGSPQAVHAMQVALPILDTATTVLVAVIGGDLDADPAAALGYLARHDVHAKLRTLAPVAGTGPGRQLLAAAHDERADLLVLGSDGHAPWREFLRGGRIDPDAIPILLSN